MVPCETSIIAEHKMHVKSYHGNTKALQKHPNTRWPQFFIAQKWSAGKDKTLSKVSKNIVVWIQSYVKFLII